MKEQIGKLTVVWDKNVYAIFEKACKRIEQDSVINANNVRKEVLTITKSLSDNPEKFPADKYKIDNDGTYRAFEKYRFRISYNITSNQIRILRFRSTDQEAKNY